MRNTNMKVGKFRLRLASMVVVAVLPLLLVGSARSSFAQTSKPKTFSSAGEAANALFQAVQKEDEQTLEAIFGAGKEVTSSSDEVEDKLEHERFAQKYQEMHRGSRTRRKHRAVYRCRELAVSHSIGLKERCMVLRFGHW